MYNRKICMYYRHPKECTNDEFCMEQLMSNPTHCCSNLYYSMGLEQEIKNEKEVARIDINNLDQACSELKKELEEEIQQCEKLKQALDEIEYQVRELFLGVENKDRPYCENILDIINKAKGGK